MDNISVPGGLIAPTDIFFSLGPHFSGRDLKRLFQVNYIVPQQNGVADV